MLCRREADARARSSTRSVLVACLGVVAISGAAFVWWTETRSERAGDSSASGPGGEAPPDDAGPAGSGPRTVRFSAPHPGVSDGELSRRAGLTEPERYDLSRESFQLVVPAGYASGTEHGLLVWISAGPSGGVPRPDWHAALQKHRVIWVGANGSGNRRAVNVRVGLALHAAHNVMRSRDIDPNRVWVGGFSGGAKSALRALLGYPEVFRGGLFCAGADYFRRLPARHRGRYWPARFARPPYLSTAKQRAIALTTAPNDPNWSHVSAVFRGMREDGFARAQLLTEPGLGHREPSAATLERAIAVLDGE